MFGLFFRKKEVEQIKEETRNSFQLVKEDMNSIGMWIKHLDFEKNASRKEIEKIKEVLSTLQEEVEGIKNVVSLLGELKVQQTPQQVSKKQTLVYGVQAGVQTGVQTPDFQDFSSSEKAIIWMLLNTDLKLGYDDLAVMLNKQKSTVRGQINSIKQKSELIEEIVEKNGKKRVYIPDHLKEKLLKMQKVRVKKGKKDVKEN